MILEVHGVNMIDHMISVTCARPCYAFLGSKHNIFLSDERGNDNNNAMTVDGVPGAPCGEGKTHVVLLAAFTAGLKVKDSHRGNARPISESGRSLPSLRTARVSRSLLVLS